MRKGVFIEVCMFMIAGGFCGAEVLSIRAGAPSVEITSWVYRETPVQPGSLVDAEITDGFVGFDGKQLSLDPTLSSRMYTFRTDFTLDEAARQIPLALFVGPGDYPRDVYLNGVLLLKNGAHGDRYNATIYYSTRVLLPPQLLNYGTGVNRLAVEAFPAFERSPLGDFGIGDYYDVTRRVYLRNFFNVHFLQAATIFSLLLFFFFLALFVGSRGKDTRYLWFSLVCLSFSVGYSNMALYHDASDDVLLDKISRIGLPFTSLFLAYFTMRFTGILERRRWLKPAMAVPVVAVIPMVLVQTTKQGVAAVFSGYATGFVLMPLLVFTLVLLVFGFFRERMSARGVVLTGFLVVIAASVHDIVFITIHEIPYCYLVSYAYLVLLVGIFFVLSVEQSRLSLQLSARTAELDERNGSLGEIVRDLTRVSEGLVASSGILEKSLGDALTVVERYGVENRNILDAFADQRRKLEVEVASITERLDTSSERVPKAVEGQARAVEEVNRILREMDGRIDGTFRSATASSEAAGELARKAEESSRVIRESQSSIAKVSEYSAFLKEILIAIEDISERTHILSINAAIESARFGAQGKGFGVVAQEIRSLSDLSHESLKTSFDKINEMSEAVAESSEFSAEVSRTLTEIIGNARESAEEAAEIRKLLDDQRTISESIMKNADDLLKEARTLSELSHEEQELNGSRKAQFLMMKEVLNGLSGKLESQDERKREMFKELDRIREAMDMNAVHILELKKSVEKAREA